MALGEAYASVATLKQRLSIADNQDNDRLAAALAYASRAVEHFCSRQFNQTTTATARTYHPRHFWLAYVDDFHTTNDLVIKTDLAADGTFETTWADSDFALEPLDGVVSGQTGWPFYTIRATGSKFFPAPAGLQVTARWGWPSVPEPVSEATLLVAEEGFKMSDAPFGVAGFGEFGSIRVRQNPIVAQMLAPYRRWGVLIG